MEYAELRRNLILGLRHDLETILAMQSNAVAILNGLSALDSSAASSPPKPAAAEPGLFGSCDRCREPEVCVDHGCKVYTSAERAGQSVPRKVWAVRYVHPHLGSEIAFVQLFPSLASADHYIEGRRDLYAITQHEVNE